MMKKGASLIWAMIVSTALLFIAVTTASFVIKESRMSIRMDDSSRAYAAAESGIEWGKYCLQNIPGCSAGEYGPFYLGTSEYRVHIFEDNKIESRGTSSGVNRKLEYILSSNNKPIILDPLKAITVTGSYVQQFDYWTGSDGQGGKIGVSNGDGSQAIYFEHDNNQIYLSAKNGSSDYKSLQSVDLGAANLNLSEPYAIRVRIEYSKNFTAKLTVAKKNYTGTGPDYECVSPLMVLDLRNSGIDYSAISKFYYTNLPIVSNSGDGASYSFIGINNRNVYFDNMATLGGMSGEVYVPVYYNLTVSSTSGGTITGREERYLPGSTATITAVPTANYVFRGWSNCATGTTNPLTVVMTSDKTCTATFSRTYFDFNTGTLTDYYYTMQVGGGIDLLPGGTNWGTPDGSGKSLFLNGVYAGPCTVGWQDPNDAYVTMRIYIPPTATTISFQAAGGVGAGGVYHNDAILAQVRAIDWNTVIASWGANSNGENTLISGHSTAPPQYAGWYTYSANVTAYRGQDVYLYFRSHVGCWWSTIIIDNVRVN